MDPTTQYSFPAQQPTGDGRLPASYTTASADSSSAMPPACHPPIATPWCPTVPGSSRGGSRNRSQSSHRRNTSGVRAAIFSPRPMEDLHVERSYLMASLVTQEARATEFVLRLSNIDVKIANGELPDSRRTRKQRSLLRSKIANTAEQERAILIRLSELYVEIQSRERWSQAQLHQQQQQQPVPTMYPDPVHMGYSPYGYPMTLLTPLTPLTPIGFTTLSSPTSPASMIHGPIAFHNPWESQSDAQPGYWGMTAPRRCSVNIPPTVTEEAYGGSGDVSPHTSTDGGPVRMGRSVSLDSPLDSGARERRMSTPALRSVWPGSLSF